MPRRPADRPSSPVGILEIGPATITVAMIDHDIGHRLDTVPEQRLQRGPMLVEATVAVIEPIVLFRIIAGATSPAYEGGGSQIRSKRPSRMAVGSSARYRTSVCRRNSEFSGWPCRYDSQ